MRSVAHLLDGATRRSAASPAEAPVAMRGPDGPHDLSDPVISSMLLDEPFSYRERAVDDVLLATAGHYELRRSIQLGPIAPVLTARGVPVPEGPSCVVIPLSLLLKAPLLDFDATGPDGERLFLLDATERAERQAHFLETSAAAVGVDVPPTVRCLLVGMGLFLPGMLDEPRRLASADAAAATRTLLNNALGTTFTRDQVVTWQATTRQVGDILTGCSGRRSSEDSASENALFALVKAPVPPRDAGQVEDVLAGYLAFVQQLVEAGATHTLRWLDELGRNYIAFVEATIDPRRRTMLKMRMRRPLPIRSTFRWQRLGREGPRVLPTYSTSARVQMVMTEGRASHLTIRSGDESVDVSDIPTITTQSGHRVPREVFSGNTPSSDGHLFFTDDPARPDYICLDIPLRVSADIRRSLLLVGVLTFTALVVVGLPWQPLDSDALAVLTLPATIAATILLSRERTTLAAHVLGRGKSVLVVLVIALWLATLVRLLVPSAQSNPPVPATIVPASPSDVSPSAPPSDDSQGTGSTAP